jgi:hypothetical protein
MTNLIGFVGKKRSGKNLCTKIWELLDIYHRKKDEIQITDVEFVLMGLDNHYYHNSFLTINGDLIAKHNLPPFYSYWQQHAFADKLKEIVCKMTGCSMQDLEDGDFKESMWKDGITFRMLLQQTADKLKELYGDDIFVNLLFNDINIDEFYLSNYTIPITEKKIITDVRLIIEAFAIKQRGGKLIRVVKTPSQEAINEMACKMTTNELIEHLGHGDIYIINDCGEGFKWESIKEEYQNLFNRMYDMWCCELTSNLDAYIGKDSHASEIEQDNIEVDYTIIAKKGDIEHLIAQVKSIMIQEGVINDNQRI